MNTGENTPMLERTIIRFAGDSGDGMQLLGNEWSKACGMGRYDLKTAPDFPAEIRAPAGTLAGVSGFQIQFGQEDILTAGDLADVLVALNPAALKNNLCDLRDGGLLIVNTGSFSDLALSKAGYCENPLMDHSLSSYQVISIDMNDLLRRSLKDTQLSFRDIQKCKNFFCLGLLFWLYSRNKDPELDFIAERFKKKPDLKQANTQAFLSGYAYGENTEAMPPQRVVNGATLEPGTYRTISGNKALALGLVAASHRADLPLFYASYPITPASDILHDLASFKAQGANTFQMEDEMAAISAAIGASFAGSLGASATSGPGFALKTEALGYAVMVELPLLVIDVQRAGPSTGMPTKTEQADLMQSIYGRSGEAPIPVIAAMSPGDCFLAAIDAARIAIDFMTPVIILSDAHIANSRAPWRIPDLLDIPPIVPKKNPIDMPYQVYQRHEDTLGRAWITPGSKELRHQIGGLEKNSLGRISYDPDNHQNMVRLRQKKIEGVRDALCPPSLFGSETADILLVGFGSTFGAIRQATIDLLQQKKSVAHLHIRLLNPLHTQIGDMLRSCGKVVVVEQNQGQLIKLLREKFLIDAEPLNKVSGKPFLITEIVNHILSLRNSKTPGASRCKSRH